MSHPKTAILVLNYNGLKVTQKFLKDLYDNTKDFFLIILDNDSKDGSVEYLGDFAAKNDNVTFLTSDFNSGVIGGRNICYANYASMEEDIQPGYLIFLDNDQYVQKGWLQQHHDVLSESEADIVGVEAWYLSKSFKPISKCDRPSAPWSYVGCGGMMMKREVPEKIGMFDDQFNPCYFEDPDLCFRAVDAGFKLCWNNKARIVHLAHQSLGKNPRRMQLFMQSYRKFQNKWEGRNLQHFRQHRVAALK